MHEIFKTCLNKSVCILLNYLSILNIGTRSVHEITFISLVDPIKAWVVKPTARVVAQRFDSRLHVEASLGKTLNPTLPTDMSISEKMCL